MIKILRSKGFYNSRYWSVYRSYHSMRLGTSYWHSEQVAT